MSPIWNCHIIHHITIKKHIPNHSPNHHHYIYRYIFMYVFTILQVIFTSIILSWRRGRRLCFAPCPSICWRDASPSTSQRLGLVARCCSPWFPMIYLICYISMAIFGYVDCFKGRFGSPWRASRFFSTSFFGSHWLIHHIWVICKILSGLRFISFSPPTQIQVLLQV